jgi:hypothetical protein
MKERQAMMQQYADMLDALATSAKIIPLQRKRSRSTEALKLDVNTPGSMHRMTFSVFAAQARYPASSVTIAGASNTFVRVGDAGSRSTFHFCPTCGATVYYTSEDREDSIAIPVGAFTDPDFPAPTFSVYEERMHTWVEMPASIEHIA